MGQYIRAKRICSTNTKFENQARDLHQRFKDRGYQKKVIDNAYHRAKNINRVELLHSQKKRTNTDKVRYITPFNSHANEVRQAFSKHWNILRSDETLGQYVDQVPSITFKRAPNLRDTLVRSHYAGNQAQTIWGVPRPKWGCRPCGSCIACPNVIETDEFWDSSKEKKFKITHTINCGTIGVVYFATCPCDLIYIGLTSRELKKRVREHVLSIKAAHEEMDLEKLKPIARHFKIHHACKPEFLKVRGIDRILLDKRGGDWRKKLAQCETKWIYTLNTVAPAGLNEAFNFAAFL